jgi:hypothetical protein
MKKLINHLIGPSVWTLLALIVLIGVLQIWREHQWSNVISMVIFGYLALLAISLFIRGIIRTYGESKDNQ